MSVCLGFVFFWLKPEHICVHAHTRARTHTRAHSRKQISSQFCYVTHLSECSSGPALCWGKLRMEKKLKQTQRRKQECAWPVFRGQRWVAGRRGQEVHVRENGGLGVGAVVWG